MTRTLHLTDPLERGEDVVTLQTALHAHGYHVAVDGVFGPHTAAAVERAKWDLGYPQDEIKACAGARFASLLAGGDRPALFKVLALERVHASHHDEAVDRIRAAIVNAARWGIAHEPEIHYREQRPIDGAGHPWKLPLETDCSGFATDCYEWAHGPDPNGNNFDGLGYTGTMLAHGKPVTLAQAKPADLVIFGAYPGHHVAIVLDNDGVDPELASHGQEKGPFAIRFSVERQYQPAGVAFRSYL